MDEAEKAFDRTGLKQRNFHEVTYAAKTWDRERRVVVKAEWRKHWRASRQWHPPQRKSRAEQD